MNPLSAKDQLCAVLTRETYNLTAEEAEAAWENADAVLSMFRSTVRILVRTAEDRMLAETPDRGNRNCVRCSGGPYQFCACTQDCGFPGCKWNDTASKVMTGGEEPSKSCMRCTGAGVTCSCTANCGAAECSRMP